MERIIYVCSICYKQYDCTNELKEHMKSFHKLREKQPKQQMPSLYYENFKRFLRKDFIFECPQNNCNYFFTSERDLMLHINCHPTEVNPKFRCCQDSCEKEEDVWKLLTIHLWRVHRVNLGMMSCPVCSYKSLSALQIWRHMKVHKNWRSKVLRPVKRVPVTKSSKEFTLPKTKYYSEKTCEICERKFVNGKTLSKHVKSVHLKIKPFICNVCGFKCSRKSVLDIHVRQHKGEKPLACNICPFKTRDQSSLEQHKKRHRQTSQKYQCFVCEYNAIQSTNLKTHIRTKHPERYKDISCDLCSFVTVNSETLAAHKRDHRKGLISKSNEENEKKIHSNSIQEKAALVTNEISSDCFLPMESTDSINHEPAVLDTGGVTIPAHSEDAQF